jgi:protein translocase SecG subunit
MQIATISPVLTLIFGVLIMILVLLQKPQTDSAGAFSADSGSSTRTRRGGEKMIFTITIVVSILFVLSAILTLVARS